MKKSQSALLGIDIGTTNIKCVALDPEGNLIAIANEPNGSSRKVDGFMQTMDGDLLFAAVCRLVGQVVSVLADRFSPLKISGMATASVGCQAILLDSDDKQLMLPEIKTEPIDTLCDPDFYATTGYPSDYSNMGFLLSASARNHPGSLDEIRSVLSIADYIGFRLTGNKLRDFSTAGSMSMLELENPCWWPRFKAVSGLSDDVLGKLKPSGAFLGEIKPAVAAETGLPDGTQVFSGGHDYLCAAFAAGCVGGNRFINVIGTYEMLASFHKKPLIGALRQDKRILIDHHTYPGSYSFTSEAICGGQVEWLRSLLHPGNLRLSDIEWDGLFKQLDALPLSFERNGGHEIFIPRVFGDVFPNTDSLTAAGFLGLTPATTPTRLLRAMIEGVSFQAREMADYQVEATGIKDPEIMVVGGGSRSRFWLQTKADILGRALTVPAIKEATAAGAALLAGVGAGVYASYDEAAHLLDRLHKDVYLPNPDRHAIYEAVYHKAYQPLLQFSGSMDHILADFPG